MELNFKLFLSLFFLSITCIHYTGSAQARSSKSLPKPRFYVLGTSEDAFPKFIGSLNDSNALIAYGKKIDLWLSAHPKFIKKAKESRSTFTQINHDFFNSLNADERLKFKESAVFLSFVLRGQKQKLKKEYIKNSPNKPDDFVENCEQLYFVHIDFLNDLINLIKG